MKIAKGVNIAGGVIGVVAGIIIVVAAAPISGITGLIGMGTSIVQTVGAVMVGAGIIGMVAEK